MESTRSSKVELIKPVFLMAGIPLAFSVAGFILSRITDRKNSALTSDSTSIPCSENEDNLGNTHEKNPLEEEILGLRSKIEQLQEREWEIEAHFLRYHDLKEKECVLMEFQNNLLLERERAEFLGRELSSMEAENQRFEEMVIDYLKILEELESSRLENGLLQRKVKKLGKRTKERSCIARKKDLQIQAREAVISRNDVELERRENTIKGLENEVEVLQEVIRQLQEEKNELMNKVGVEGAVVEDYNQLVNEVEKLQKDRAVEVKELIYLRWCNACLRHELMRRNPEQEEEKSEKKNETKNELELDCGQVGDYCSENEPKNFILPHDEPFFGFDNGDQGGHSKRRWLIRKFKKWVEGSERSKHKSLDEKEKHEFKCFGSHSVCDDAEERHFPARKSYSSA